MCTVSAQLRSPQVEVSYYTQCYNFWKNGCPRISGSKIKCRDCGRQAYKKLEKQQIMAHLWIFFQIKIEVSIARKFGNALLRKGAESVNLKSFRYYDRMLPMQDNIPQGGVGNLIALPLQGHALKKGNSAFIDENWNTYPDQWKILFIKPKLSKEFIEDKIKEWKLSSSYNVVGASEIDNNDGEKPWDKTKHFMKSDVEGKLCITLANGVYVDTSNLNARIQNRIREMAAFRNPAFYKNQAMGLSNFLNARYIYLGNDENE